MTLRPWIIGGLVLVGAGVNVYLLSEEEVAAGEKVIRHEMERADPLLGIQYDGSQREVNLRRFGLEGDALKQGMKRLRDLDDDRNRAILNRLVDDAPEPDLLSDALCGQDEVEARYGALAFLVEESGGRRDPIDIRRTSRLERQDWALEAPIPEVFATVELARERQPDATVMGLAAILVGREADVLEGNSPWGPGLGARWSWSAVEKEHPGIGARVIEYLASMHLLMEVVTAEGGFCGDQ